VHSEYLCRPFKFNFRVYTYQEILLTNFRCTFLVISLSLLNSLNPNIDIVFLLFVLQYILIIGNVSNSSVKLLRKSNLFRAQRIFMLHIEMELSLTLE
jgi:hypothetical protein